MAIDKILYNFQSNQGPGMRTAIFEGDQQILGKGAIGHVIKVRQGDRCYAIKKISRQLIRNHGRLKQLNREVEIMRKIDHENVVKIQGFMESQDEYMIKMQFCQGENLKQFLLSNEYAKLMNSNTPNYYPVQISLDLINALAKIRSKLISNRDIKPQNIIVNLSPNGKISAKMIDFGQAKFHITLAVSLVGTPGYMAPQIRFKGSYSEACDDWSLGWVLYQLFNHPYQKNGKNKQLLICPFKENFQPHIQGSFYHLYNQYIYEPISLQKSRNPEPIRSIIRNLLRVDPNQRYRLQKTLQILVKEFNKISIYLPQTDRNRQFQKLQQSLIELQESKLKRQNVRGEIQALKISYVKIITVIMNKVRYEQIATNFQFVKFFMKVYLRIDQAIFLISRDLQVNSQYVKQQIIHELITKKKQLQTANLFNRVNNYLLRNKIILPENFTFDKVEVRRFMISNNFTSDQVGTILANLDVITFQDN